MNLKIVSWNINGIRSVPNLFELFNQFQAHILCFQESKLTNQNIPHDLACLSPYASFAVCSNNTGGYSGVMIYVHASIPTYQVYQSFSSLLLPQTLASLIEIVSNDIYRILEREGRILGVDLGPFILLNVYAPNLGDDSRNPVKIAFELFLSTIVYELVTLQQREIILVGDLNVCCNLIDHCDPCPEFFESMHGRWFREILTTFSIENTSANLEYCTSASSTPLSTTFNFPSSQILESVDHRLIDMFRHFYPTRLNAFTCWNTVTSARLTNYGTRIDYILESRGLLHLTSNMDHLPDVMGSDHCPLYLEFHELPGETFL